MLQDQKLISRGYIILFEEWGRGYRRSTSTLPILPTESVGEFMNPSPEYVAEKLIREIGFVLYNQLIIQILSLKTQSNQLKLVETLGFPPKEQSFFYLDAVYVIIATSWNNLQNRDQLLELLIDNLFSFGLAHECVPYLLHLLMIPVEQALSLMEKRLNHHEWRIREGVISFFYSLYGEMHYSRFSNVHISKEQLGYVYKLLEHRLTVEENQEIYNSIEKIIVYFEN